MTALVTAPIATKLPGQTTAAGSPQQAIPPDLLDPEQAEYQAVGSDFTGLVNDTLGNSMTGVDGFDAIFDPAADIFPGPDIVPLQLDPLISDFSGDVTALGVDPDPSFEADLAQALDLGANVTGSLYQEGIDVQQPLQDSLGGLVDLGAGGPPPGFILTSPDVAIEEIADSFVQITPDGTVSWYIQSTEPDPIGVYAATDGGPWTLWVENRQGNQSPGWIVPGHFYAFEWRSPNGVIAQAYLDLTGIIPQTLVVQQSASVATNPVAPQLSDVTAGEFAAATPQVAAPGVTQAPPGNGPTQIPAVPAGLIPSGSLTVSPNTSGQGSISWNSTNAAGAVVQVIVAGQPTVVLATGSSGTQAIGQSDPTLTYVFQLVNLLAGQPVQILASYTVAAGSLPVPTPAVANPTPSEQGKPIPGLYIYQGTSFAWTAGNPPVAGSGAGQPGLAVTDSTGAALVLPVGSQITSNSVAYTVGDGTLTANSTQSLTPLQIELAQING